MDGLHISAHKDVVLFILNQKRSAIADIENRFNLTVVLLADDSLIAPEYKVDHVGWQGRSSSKQSSRQAQQRHQDNKNVAADDNDAAGGETSANILEFPPNDKDGDSEDDNPKTASSRTTRRRRRRRRNEEGAQASENLSTRAQSSDPNTSQLSKQESHETQNVANDQQDKRSQRLSQSAKKTWAATNKNDAKNGEALNSEGKTGQILTLTMLQVLPCQPPIIRRLMRVRLRVAQIQTPQRQKNQLAVEKKQPQVPIAVQK